MIKDWLYKKFSFLQKPPAWVLMYHRISNEPIDPWDISISPEIFELQLQWLIKNFNILSLEQLVVQWKEGLLKKHTTALTFDDGYLDNLTVAKPLLEKYNIPATFFITDHTRTQEPYWWDVLHAIIVEKEQLPHELNLKINNKEVKIILDDEAIMDNSLRQKLMHWKGLNKTGKRAQAFTFLRDCLLKCTHQQQKEVLEQIKREAGIKEQIHTPAIMNNLELIQLLQNPLFTVGAHTQTHLSLKSADKQTQQREILGNRMYLRQLVEKKIKFIAFPYGDYNNETLDIVKEEGFEAAFNSEIISLLQCRNPFRLGRVTMTNRLDINVLK